jgi:uncharacterized protein YndB with AHSA1/START domain
MTTKAIKPAAPRMSDDAVKAKTGKTWKQWFTLLDKAGARKLSHPEIVKHLHEEHGVGPWWRQMVTVTYEQSRGLRKKNQRPDGFQISVSRTVAVPLASLYKAFETEKSRNRWLKEDGLAVRTATANKSIRGAWNEVKTSLEISFVSKGDEKSQVVVTHSKLPNTKASATMKAFWGKALDRLRASLEK